MDYKIMNRDAFEIVGSGLRTSIEHGENFKRIPQFWEECMKSGDYNRIMSFNKTKPMLGICMDFNHDEGTFSYYIAVEKPANVNETKFETKVIPASSWAVFEAIGPLPNSIQTVIAKIHTEWLNESGYRHTGGPELEVYYKGDSSNDDYKCEVWIPVKKKEQK